MSLHPEIILKAIDKMRQHTGQKAYCLAILHDDAFWRTPEGIEATRTLLIKALTRRKK